MTGDVERLQEQLTDAEGNVDQVRSNLITLTRQAYDDRERYDLSLKSLDAKIKETDRKLGASVLNLPEHERLCAEAKEVPSSCQRREYSQSSVDRATADNKS